MINPTTVLLVDDSATFLRLLTRFLQEHNHNEVAVVGTAGGGKEALAKAEDLRPQVILLDLAMPGLSGLEAIPHLRRILPNAGIIMLALLNASGYREAALAAGADDFVSKDVLHTDLMPTIRRVAHADRPLKKAVDTG